MEQIGKVDTKVDFMAVYSSVILRDGAAAMLHWLNDKTDFFTAPASRNHHMAHPGGLAVHSLNVWRRLREITVRDLTNRGAPGMRRLPAEEEETVAILGLLHDVCKINAYHANEDGRYSFHDQFPLGHGEKSLFLISRYMRLTMEEALAIRWHMGAYDDAVRGGSHAMTAAMNMTPWVWRLQEADMCATWIDERSDA